MTNIRLLMVTASIISLIGSVGFANAETQNTVEVTSFPFGVYVLEGGSITFNNQGDSPMNFVSYGWFDGTVAIGDSLTIDLPITNCGNTCYFADVYYIRDLSSGEYSTLTIVKPTPPPQPVVETVEEPIIQEIVEETTQEDGIYNVLLTDGEYDVISLQEDLIRLTTELNSSFEIIGQKNNEISVLNSQITLLTNEIETNDLALLSANSTIISLEQQLLNQTSVDYSEYENQITSLEQNIVDLTDDRDKWKTLAHSWYSVALEQLRVMTQVLGIS